MITRIIIYSQRARHLTASSPRPQPPLNLRKMDKTVDLPVKRDGPRGSTSESDAVVRPLQARRLGKST